MYCPFPWRKVLIHCTLLKILFKLPRNQTMWVLAGIAQSVQWLATGWTIRGSNPGVGKVFRNRPDRPWGLPSLLYNGYRVSFPELKRPGRGTNHPHPSSAEVNGRIELCLYSPSEPSWPLLGRTLPFTFLDDVFVDDVLMVVVKIITHNYCHRPFGC